ncbi:MAG: dTMP kinase [Puniceicoccales bacterium]|jgi:dTMP kinase|nr:dTMP kinase [Puniceicoccales bacterium]
MVRGFFISFEGSEGVGKSTHAALLCSALQRKGFPVISLREPGGTAFGEEIRLLLKRTDFENPPCAEAELLLFLANRAQLVREKIMPQLERGAIVICDRYCDSTVAYQGAARALPMDTIRQINAFAIGGCVPDLTFFLDLDPLEGFRRIRNGRGETPDRLEMEPPEFFAKVRSAYLKIAGEEPERFRIVDGSLSIGQLQKMLLDLVEEHMKEKW